MMYVMLKNNRPMLLTLISGSLILLGGILSYSNVYPLDALVYVSAFITGGYFQGKEGLSKLLVDRKLTVDILMVLAAIGASLIGYWLEGALLIFIFSLSGSLEIYTTNKSTDAIAKLMQLTPDTALLVEHEGAYREVPISELKPGDILFVPKGTAIPIDGHLKSDYALVDESAISGESNPVNKEEGSEVIGGTVNVSKGVMMKVSTDFSDTLFAKIIRLVDEAQGTPSKTATFIDSLETGYVKIILIFVPLMIGLFYFGINWSFTESFYRGMVLLTVASPCALMASASPATLSAISNGAKNGVLYKGGSFLENFSQINAIAFDKTGTLTKGTPQVTDIQYADYKEKDTINQIIFQLERVSSHPLARAVCGFLETEAVISQTVVVDLVEKDGKGIEGYVGNDHWKIGKKEYAVQNPFSTLLKEAENAQTEGKTVLYVTKNGEIKCFIVLFDLLAEGSNEMIAYFKSQGIYTILITGDNQSTGATIGKSLGVDEVKANCLPDEKAHIVKQLKEKYGTVVMVGDGINDAPALAHASVGIAMGAGTDLAMEAADVVLVKNELKQLIYSHKLSKKLNTIIKQNIIFSISVIIILMSINLLQLISLPLGVIGHEGSTILVIVNGLRLLRIIK